MRTATIFAAATTVVLMAGGRGTRLSPITEDVPKPMVEIAGKPILATIVERFVAQGFTRIFIAVNYKAEVIERHFGDGTRHGARIGYLREDTPLGTAGALSLLPAGRHGTTIVMNGDLLARVNFHHLLAFHRQRASPATMGVFEYKHTVPFGVVRIDDRQQLEEIVEKPVHRYLASAGIYALEPAVIDLVPPGVATTMPELFQRVKAAGQGSAVFPLREYWIDIGRPDDLRQARAAYPRGFPGD